MIECAKMNEISCVIKKENQTFISLLNFYIFVILEYIQYIDNSTISLFI